MKKPTVASDDISPVVRSANYGRAVWVATPRMAKKCSESLLGGNSTALPFYHRKGGLLIDASEILYHKQACQFVATVWKTPALQGRQA